jgi:NADH-quinone oxidoreductase subunit J
VDFLVAHGGALVFWLFAALMVVAAVLVVTLRNPMYGAIALLVSFLSVAVLFLLQHAEFLAGVQIFVYGGGIMVLFLFVIMLVNLQGLRESSRFLEQLPWAAILLVLAVATFGVVAASAEFGGIAEAAPTVVDGKTLGNSETVGWYLYRDYLLPFEVASVFLLVAMIGAVVLGRRD